MACLGPPSKFMGKIKFKLVTSGVRVQPLSHDISAVSTESTVEGEISTRNLFVLPASSTALAKLQFHRQRLKEQDPCIWDLHQVIGKILKVSDDSTVLLYTNCGMVG